jgi:ABC-type transport system involved in multi-copper enzyme maturation permease subunit
MLPVFYVTVRGIFRDRVFHGILMTSVIFLFIPSISTLSMRQVTELSVTLSLSFISFILLLLSVFLGGTSLWKDIERRYTFSVIGLPISRTGYVLGKFAGIAGFILFTSVLLGSVACIVVWVASGIYPPFRPVVWPTLFLSIIYDALKYILLVAVSFLVSSVSTSFFLPVFGTISTFLVGSASQQVYDFVNSPAAANLSPVVRRSASILYYVLPNFSAFDLKVNAVYGIDVSSQGLLLTLAYCVVYTSVVISLASLIFSRRELQ